MVPPLSSLVALDVVKNVVSCATCDNTVSIHDNSFRYCSRHFPAMVPGPARVPDGYIHGNPGVVHVYAGTL